MQVVVIKHYKQPYENPISVAANDRVTPDFGKTTDMAGWVWCSADDGRSGWTPRNWLVHDSGRWKIDRDFDAIELTVEPDEVLNAVLEESGFFWVTRHDGSAGWIPCEHVSVLERT